MSREGRLGTTLLGVAVALGALGDVLFHGRPAGLNVFLFAACFVGALGLLLKVSGAPLHQGRRWMALPLLVFAAAFVWHDSPLLAATNVLALAGAVSLGALRRAQPRPGVATVSEYAAGLASAGAGALAGGARLLTAEVPWQGAAATLRGSRAAAVGRGAALGLPVLLVFGGLFAAADTVFADLISSSVPSLGNLPAHAAIIAGVAWLTAGLLRDLAARRDDERVLSADRLLDRVRRPRVGVTEIGVVLAALDLLFLTFVLVQARYLFGGGALVEARAHLTYAQYARHGFFELVVVSVLVLPVLLAANVLVRSRVVRVLSALLVVLELVVALSALQRLRVYEHEYGLTELRIYATGVVAWLIVVFAWSCATVLRGELRRFAIGAVISGFAATAALNVISPDALIARTNLTRPHVDVAYLAHLSDDAVPTLVNRLSAVHDPAVRRELAQRLLARSVDGQSLLSWNAARSRSRSVLLERRDELRSLAR
jgi:Domain of unknown function (DUF4153)